VADPVGTQAQDARDQTSRRPFYAGATLHVRSYDSINSGDGPAIRGDARFYLDLARRAGGEVLEIGVGTGRVALQLAAAGIRVTGVDASDAMMAIAAEKAASAGVADRLRLERVDMRTFQLAVEKFALAIVPFRAFQLLLSVEDQLAALAAIRRHLRPDGCLVLHLFDPNLRLLLPGASGPIERQVGVDRDTGRRVEGVLEAAELDQVNQVRRDLWRYRAFAADGTVAEEELLELSLRWTFRWEMRHLLRLAGFTIEAEFSDFMRAGPAYGQGADLGCARWVAMVVSGGWHGGMRCPRIKHAPGHWSRGSGGQGFSPYGGRAGC
jgi:SAM-dependent methyltransferase